MRATEFITELFQQATVPWVWQHRSSDEASVLFNVGPQYYRFYACNSPDDPEEWEIEFAATSKYSNGPSNDKLKYDYDLNGAGSGALVMSTVVSIMREFLKEYNHKISSIQFSAKEKSRQKLYTRMLQRLLPSWTFSRSIDSFSGSEKYLLTKPSDITEVINTDIMHRNFKHQQQIGDYIFKAKSVRFNRQKIVLLRISCYKGKEEIGYADFEIKGPGHGRGSDSRLESDMTWVAKDHRQEGIASTMYAYAKMLGNDITPGSSQLPPGKKMWDAWKKSGEAEHLMAEEEPIKISNNNAAKVWIERVYQKYPYTMQNNHVMTWGSGDDQQFAMFELTPSFSKRGAVEVKWFQAYPLRQGVGSRAMQELQAMAREDGISLTLYPWDKGQVSQSKLTKFYRGQGFAPAVKGSKHMQWEPK